MRNSEYFEFTSRSLCQRGNKKKKLVNHLKKKTEQQKQKRKKEQKTKQINETHMLIKLPKCGTTVITDKITKSLANLSVVWSQNIKKNDQLMFCSCFCF